MRVLLTHTSTLPDRMGGSERVMWQVARGLADHGHEVRIVARRTAPALPAHSRVDGVEIRRYGDPAHSFAVLYLPSIALARAALLAAGRAWSPTLVHAHHSIVGLAARLAHLGPIAYTFYGPWHLEFLHEVLHRTEMSAWRRRTRPLWAPAKATWARRLERAALRASQRVVVLSRYSATQVTDIHRVSGPRVATIPGGVDLAHFTPPADRGQARRGLGLNSDGPLLFTVRRLVPRMGLEGLLEALAGVPRARLVIGGSGWLGPRLEQRAADLGVADRVRFAGFVTESDLPRYYQAADLVVLPSVALEGFGLITLEALACGTPVVATPASGAVDVLEPLDPGWLAADASPPALARTIVDTLACTRDAATVRDRCRAHAERYSWDRVVGQYEDLYRSLVAAPGDP